MRTKRNIVFINVLTQVQLNLFDNYSHIWGKILDQHPYYETHNILTPWQGIFGLN
jgi:hypothetical protein